jgi:hypothetical protein
MATLEQALEMASELPPEQPQMLADARPNQSPVPNGTADSPRNLLHPAQATNAARDKVHQRALRKLGWRVIVFWECETNTKSVLMLARKLKLTHEQSAGT